LFNYRTDSVDGAEEALRTVTDATGSVILNGDLRLEVARGLDPPPGTSWTLISSSSLAEFAGLDVVGLSSGKRITVEREGNAAVATILVD
jgi:hypothetical protein